MLAQPTWAPAIALLAAAILLFPDGRLPSRLWRWPLRLYLAVAALWVGGAFAISATAVAGHHIRIDAGGALAIIDHPAGAAVLWGMAQDLFFTVLPSADGLPCGRRSGDAAGPEADGQAGVAVSVLAA